MKKMVYHFHLKYCQAPVLNHFFSAIYSFFDSKTIFFFLQNIPHKIYWETIFLTKQKPH